MKLIVAVMMLSAIAFGQSADELEARYGLCFRHSIPEDKCTVDVYRQLFKKDSAAKAAKNKRDLFLLRADTELIILHSCTEFAEIDAHHLMAVTMLTQEALKKCSDASDWLTKNGFGDAVKREAELAKKQECEKNGRSAWIVPSAACGPSCGTESEQPKRLKLEYA